MRHFIIFFDSTSITGVRTRNEKDYSMFSDQFKARHRLVFCLAYPGIQLICTKKRMNQKVKWLIGLKIMNFGQFRNHNMNVKLQLCRPSIYIY